MEPLRLVKEILPERFWPAVDFPNLVNIILDLDRHATVHLRLPSGKLKIRSLGGPFVTDTEIRDISDHPLLRSGWSAYNSLTIAGSNVRVSRIMSYGETSGFTINVSQSP